VLSLSQSLKQINGYNYEKKKAASQKEDEEVNALTIFGLFAVLGIRGVLRPWIGLRFPSGRVALWNRRSYLGRCCCPTLENSGFRILSSMKQVHLTTDGACAKCLALARYLQRESERAIMAKELWKNRN
jgi:hypothetical protein